MLNVVTMNSSSIDKIIDYPDLIITRKLTDKEVKDVEDTRRWLRDFFKRNNIKIKIKPDE